MSDQPICDIRQIMDMLPHRYPFLMVDRVLEIESVKRILAYKNVTVNEPFFHGHFPQQPIMPGVLIVEALAQALLTLWDARVPAARIGLAEQDGLPVLAGPRHPALGQMARARALFLRVRQRVARLSERAERPDTLLCPRRWQGEILGQGNALAADYAALGVAVAFADVAAFTLGIGGGDG